LLDFVDDVVDDLGCRDTLNFIPKMMENGTGADRQLKVYEETKSLESVVDYIGQQFLEGI
jgi:carboxylate-amine ligase